MESFLINLTKHTIFLDFPKGTLQGAKEYVRNAPV